MKKKLCTNKHDFKDEKDFNEINCFTTVKPFLSETQPNAANQVIKQEIPLANRNVPILWRGIRSLPSVVVPPETFRE